MYRLTSQTVINWMGIIVNFPSPGKAMTVTPAKGKPLLGKIVSLLGTVVIVNVFCRGAQLNQVKLLNCHLICIKDH